jgi:hypothetical protein
LVNEGGENERAEDKLDLHAGRKKGTRIAFENTN